MNDELIQGYTTGERLKNARKLMKLTQEDASYISGVPRSTLANYEADRSTPMAKQLTALCDIYHVSPSFIMTGSLHPSVENSAPTCGCNTQSPQTTRLMNTVRGMDEDKIGLIADIAETVKKHK